MTIEPMEITPPIDEIRVLHVDDEPDFAELLAEFLPREDSRIRIETANSADEGLELLTEHQFDCVVSDYDMPRKNGIEFLEDLRDEYPELPFILFTGKGSEEVASDAISAGVTDYLQKQPGSDQYTILANRITNAVRARRAASKADQTRQRLAQILKTVPECIVQLNRDGEFIFANERATEVLGLEQSAVIDRRYNDPAWEIRDLDGDPIPDEDLPFRQVRDTGNPVYGFRHTIQWPDGSQRVLLVNGAPLRDEDGEVEYVVFALTDITDRVETEQQLRETKEWYQRILEHISDYVVIVDQHGEISYVSPAVERVTRYDPDDVIGRNAFEFVHPDDQDQAAEAFAETLEQTDHDVSVQYRTTTKDGSYKWIEVRGGNYLDDPVIEGVMVSVREISERKRRDQELQQERDRFRAVFEEAFDAMVLADDEGQYIDANESAVELFGLPEKELLGHSIKDFTPEDFDFEAAWQAFQASDSERGTFPLVRHDGTELVVEYAATRNVIPGQHLSVIRDVTDAKNYEQVIERLHDTAQEIFSAETEEQVAIIMITAIEDILELPINGVAMYDGSEDVLRTVAATERATELVGDSPVFHPGESLAWDVFETGQIAHYEDVSTVPNRHNPETAIRSEIIVPLGEHGVAMIGSTTPGEFDDTDVSLVDTLARHAVTALDRIDRQHELEVKTQRLDAILENTPTPMFMKDDTGQYLFVNEGYREIFGLSDDAIVGRTDHEIHPRDMADEVRTNDRMVIETGEPLETEERVLVDGEERWFIVTKVPIYDTGDRSDQETPVALFGVASDITEHRRREEQLQRERDRLDEFASVVSHDIRTPLSVAEGRLELLEEECDSDHIEPIDQALTRIDDMIDELLTLAREGDQVSETDLVNLAELSDRCWQNIGADTAVLQIDIDRQFRADTSRVQQLLENLFRNAVEHGGPSVSVTVGEVDEGFYVEDNGPGIPKSDRAHVFKMGYSTSAEGNGFGLSIVKQVAEAHGWEIRVTEGSEGGARFEITGIEFQD